MKKSLKLLVSLAFSALAFLAPQKIGGMDTPYLTEPAFTQLKTRSAEREVLLGELMVLYEEAYRQGRYSPDRISSVFSQLDIIEEIYNPEYIIKDSALFNFKRHSDAISYGIKRGMAGYITTITTVGVYILGVSTFYILGTPTCGIEPMVEKVCYGGLAVGFSGILAGVLYDGYHGANWQREVVRSMKQEIEETMELHRTIYKVAHPRQDEFNKIGQM